MHLKKFANMAAILSSPGGDELRGGNMNSVVRLPNIFQDAVNSLRPSYAI